MRWAMPRVVCISRRPKLLRIDLLLVRLETDREIKIFSLPDVPHLPEASPSTLFADGSFELASEQVRTTTNCFLLVLQVSRQARSIWIDNEIE